MRESVDLLVIGGGPAGLAAAAAAAEAGRRVLLVDEGLRGGGQIWRHRTRGALPRGARRVLARFDASGARALFGAAVVDLTPERTARLEVGGAALEIEAGGGVVLCTGARELFLPFPGWTLPRVVGVGGAQALLKSGMRVNGLRVVIAGSGPLLLPVAAALAKAGARLAVVAEQAPRARVLRFGAGLWRYPARIADAVRYRSRFLRTSFVTGSWVTEAHGDGRVEAVTLADGRGTREVRCDLLCVGYGLIPATELARLVGCVVERGAVRVDALQRTSVPGFFCAGETAGVAGVDAAVTQGEIAGLAAAGAEVPAPLQGRRALQLRFAAALASTFALRDELRTLARPDTLVCRCEDVPLSAVQACGSLREARLHTRIAMGPCQGRVCGAALAELFGWTDTSVRPPIAPALLRTLSAAAPDGDGRV